MKSDVDDYGHLAGYRFPSWTVTTKSHLAWLWADAAQAQQSQEYVHPSYVLLMSLKGEASGVPEILSLVDFAPEDGGLAGGYDLEFFAPLRPDVEYRVEAEITSVERKHGKRMGPFDLLTFLVTVIDPADGQTVATNTTRWMLPRVPAAEGLDG